MNQKYHVKFHLGIFDSDILHSIVCIQRSSTSSHETGIKNTHLKRNITNFNIIKTPLSKKLYFRGIGITSELGLYIIVGFNGGFFNIRHFI